ncbi:hypothetical protein Tco_0400220 [Tanacetum coccineum]
MDECLALADLCASINLMPLSVVENAFSSESRLLYDSELGGTFWITQPIGIAEDVYLKVGKFKFLADFVVMTDAKEMWDAIKSRFGGNDESKKMQKYILKQQFEGVSTEDANRNSFDLYLLHGLKVSLIMRTMPESGRNQGEIKMVGGEMHGKLWNKDDEKIQSSTPSNVVSAVRGKRETAVKGVFGLTVLMGQNGSKLHFDT